MVSQLQMADTLFGEYIIQFVSKADRKIQKSPQIRLYMKTLWQHY